MSHATKISRIESRPDVLGGKPVIRGTRISVEIVLQRLRDGYTIRDMLEDWPHVSEDDIKAAIDYATERVREPA